MDEREFAELAAGAALNALSPADRVAFQAARRDHPEWEHWVRTDAVTAAALADSVSDGVPPLTMRSTLLSRIATTPQLPPIDAAVAAAAEPVATWSQVAEPTSAGDDGAGADGTVAGERVVAEPPPTTSAIQAVSRRNWTRGILALAASMVLLVALGLGAGLINEYLNRPPAVVALQEIEGAPDAQSATVEITDGGTATAHWSESLGRAVLVSQGLPEIADDESFEMWFVRDGDAVSAGTFDPSGEPSTTTLLDGAVEAGDVIAVTVEPEGGSTTGEPTSDPIVQIPTA